MNTSIGIVGAGILGRLLAFFCVKQGWQVNLFDSGSPDGRQSCSHVAAGMLSPYCELESAEPAIADLGSSSTYLWQQVIGELETQVFFQKEGSLVVAHTPEQGDLERLHHIVADYTSDPVVHRMDASNLLELEPELNPGISRGLFFPYEGQIDTRAILSGLNHYLTSQAASQVVVHYHTPVNHIAPFVLETNTQSFQYDCVVDCRGLQAKTDISKLRGVRGEIIRIQAPAVQLKRPIRLMHPRYPLYIVPRPDHHYVIGATTVEAEDFSEISVRSALELLSAAFSLHSGFAEARILETAVHCRPALDDNLPRIFYQNGLLRVNGLYRHGFLLSPKIADLVVHFLDGKTLEAEFQHLMEEV